MKTRGEILTVEDDRDLQPEAEKYSDISTLQSIFAGLGSGLIQLPKGVMSLGASVYDLLNDTDKAAEIEKYFDDLTELDEMAEATTAGKIAELLVNVGVPGGVGFKIGSSLANAAVRAKKAQLKLKQTSFNVSLESLKKDTSCNAYFAPSSGL